MSRHIDVQHSAAAELSLKDQDLMAERKELRFEGFGTAKEVSDCGE